MNLSKSSCQHVLCQKCFDKYIFLRFQKNLHFHIQNQPNKNIMTILNYIIMILKSATILINGINGTERCKRKN